MITISAAGRRGIAAVSLTAAVAAVAACGSSGSQPAASGGSASSSASPGPGSANGSGTPTSGSPAGPTAKPSGPGEPMITTCTTSALTVSINAGQGSGAAGSTYVPIDFTNSSGRTCGMYGFPGVSFVTGRGGSQIGAAAARDSGFPSVSITVAAHGSAHAWLQVAEAGNYPPSTCKQVTANWLKVFPPGNTVAAYVSHSFQACSSTKVNVLSIVPVRSGPGVQGKVP
jgi:Domain of unknown function (DUF4232)